MKNTSEYSLNRFHLQQLDGRLIGSSKSLFFNLIARHAVVPSAKTIFKQRTFQVCPARCPRDRLRIISWLSEGSVYPLRQSSSAFKMFRKMPLAEENVLTSEKSAPRLSRSCAIFLCHLDLDQMINTEIQMTIQRSSSWAINYTKATKQNFFWSLEKDPGSRTWGIFWQ